MFGLGVLKGLGITLKHFYNTFVDDLKYFPKSTLNEEAFARKPKSIQPRDEPD